MSRDGIASKTNKIKTIGTIEDRCLTLNAKDLAKFITENFTVTTDDFQDSVTISRETPGPEKRGNLWVRLDTNNNFMGFYMFNGTERSWVLVKNLLPNSAKPRERIYYRFDTTKNLEDMPKGFTLDNDPDLARDKKTSEDGKLKYAWIKSIFSDI